MKKCAIVNEMDKKGYTQFGILTKKWDRKEFINNKNCREGIFQRVKHKTTMMNS